MDLFTEATGVGNESIPTYGTLTDRDCVKRNLRSTLVSFGILKIIFKLSGWSGCGSAGRHSDLRSFSSCRFWKTCHRDSRNWITLYSHETKLASSTSVFGSLLYCNAYYGEVSTTSHSDLNCTAYWLSLQQVKVERCPNQSSIPPKHSMLWFRGNRTSINWTIITHINFSPFSQLTKPVKTNHSMASNRKQNWSNLYINRYLSTL